MKTSQKIMVYFIVGLMVMSAVALSALVFFADDGSDDTTESTPAGTININEEGDEAVASIVEGVEWPIVLEETLTELITEDIVVGTGTEAQEGDTVTVNYRLAKADGTPVAGNDTFATGSPFSSPLSGLIAAWQQGIPGMKEGGLRRLKVPSSLAYGDGDLVFDVELISTSQ